MKDIKKEAPLPAGQRWRLKVAASTRAGRRASVSRRFQRARLRPKDITGCLQDPKRHASPPQNEPFEWGPTQVPSPLRRARNRARNRIARASRKANR